MCISKTEYRTERDAQVAARYVEVWDAGRGEVVAARKGTAVITHATELKHHRVIMKWLRNAFGAIEVYVTEADVTLANNILKGE